VPFPLPSRFNLSPFFFFFSNRCLSVRRMDGNVQALRKKGCFPPRVAVFFVVPGFVLRRSSLSMAKDTFILPLHPPPWIDCPFRPASGTLSPRPLDSAPPLLSLAPRLPFQLWCPIFVLPRSLLQPRLRCSVSHPSIRLTLVAFRPIGTTPFFPHILHVKNL